MKTKTIVFTEPFKAVFREEKTKPLLPDSVQAKMEYTVISGGTERANFICAPNTGTKYPRFPGYCGVGRVTALGEAVDDLAVGDRVLVYHGRHTVYNVVPRINITKVEDDKIDSLDAAFVIIATMGLGGVRHLALEIGESCLVMGMGLLGIFAMQFARLSGAYPVIAADLDPARRTLALELGADFALDPAEPDFAQKVKDLTRGKGVNACVEVTGVAKALKQALACTAMRGRISLLGCTRVSDCPIDFYEEVHRPGITLIGSHNFWPRPKLESQPRWWTHQDDCKAVLDLLGAGRIGVRPIVSRVVKPEKAPEIYRQLAEDKEFPIGTVFDWREEV